MEVTLACFARITEVDESGKLNLLGIMRRYKGRGVPLEDGTTGVQIQRLGFAVGISCPRDEWLAGKEFRLELVPPSGDELFVFRDNPARKAHLKEDEDIHNYIFQLDGNVFKESGEYWLRIFWNDEDKGKIPLTVGVSTGDQ